MSDDNCVQCGHPGGPHALLNFTGNPEDGGIRICPVGECLCWSTWSLQGRPVPTDVPGPDEVMDLKKFLDPEEESG